MQTMTHRPRPASPAVLAANAVECYQEAILKLAAGTANSTLYMRRRDNARRTLTERCGYTDSMMAQLNRRTMRAGGTDRRARRTR